MLSYVSQLHPGNNQAKSPAFMRSIFGMIVVRGNHRIHPMKDKEIGPNTW